MNRNISFLELIKKYSIRIPEIQRDYAQGRQDSKATEIRSHFIDEIVNVLDSDKSEPLVLDFVYGSINDETKIFTPLDGQQRLTTLFLLHWYLAPDGKLDFLQKSGDSLFTYATRTSSKDFCNELVKHPLNEVMANTAKAKIEDKGSKNEKEWKLSDGFTNEPWFLWSWRKDPTVKGILVMLNAIDERLKDRMNNTDFWDKLTNEKRVVFHLLELDKFNLTDELYVKMNARGKELSSFDILKSALEEQIKKNNVSKAIREKWQTQIDSKWMDLFWNKKALPYLIHIEKNNDKCKEGVVEKVETYYLRFLKRMMYFHLFLIDDFEKPEQLSKEIFEEGIKSVREFVGNDDIDSIISYLIKCGFFNESFFTFVIDTMDSLLYEETPFVKDVSELIKVKFWNRPINNLFELFIDEKTTYLNKVLFFALIQFAKYNSGKEIIKNSNNISELNNWMRVIRNLAYNTTYNTPDEFKNTLIALKSLAKAVYIESDSKKIIDYLCEGKKISRFYGEQVSEEIEKARQIINNCNIVGKIVEAENYAFFNASIRFLFTDRNGECDWKLFVDRFIKAADYFDEKGVSDAYKANAQLICTLISLFTKWEQCRGIKIGNGVDEWGYVIRNNTLLQPLSDLLDLDSIPLEITNYSSHIAPETFDEGFEESEKLAHEDMCNNGLLNVAINTMKEGISLKRKYNQFALYRPNASADWKKYVIGNKRNKVFFDLRKNDIITTEQNISGMPYFWGWDIKFKCNNLSYCFDTNNILKKYNDEKNKWEDIEDMTLDKIYSYLELISDTKRSIK